MSTSLKVTQSLFRLKRLDQLQSHKELLLIVTSKDSDFKRVDMPMIYHMVWLVKILQGKQQE